MSSAPSRSPEERFLDLLQQARAGSGEALGRLFEARGQYLMHLARQQLGPIHDGDEHPSDIVQETLIHALRRFPQFRGHTEEEFQAWLRQILVNVALDCHRARERRHTELVDPIVPSSLLRGSPALELSAEESATTNEEKAIVRATIKELPEHYQDVLQWHFRETLSFSTIGARLGISSEAARMLCVRAMSALRTLLDEQELP